MRSKIPFAIFLIFLASNAWAQVYRCGNTYSEESCKGGRTVDTSPPVTDPRGPSTTVIYLCRAPQGGQYWTAESCHTRGWTMERSERVPINVPWADQVAAARRQKQAAQALNAAPAVQYTQQAPQQHKRTPRQECSLLDERVKMLDSMGRAGSRYYDLDWIRRERKEARDQQFRLRC